MQNPDYRTDHHLELAIFRLRDVCVRVQGDLKAYLATAALEPAVRIRPTFEWLRKRGVAICLLSDFDAADTELLLTRLGWQVGPDKLLRLVLSDYRQYEEPLRVAHERCGLKDGSRTVVAADLPELLREARTQDCRFVVGICTGKRPYQDLAPTPHDGLLDYALQLPNFLLRNLPQPELPLPARERSPAGLPMLWLSFNRYRLRW